MVRFGKTLLASSIITATAKGGEEDEDVFEGNDLFSEELGLDNSDGGDDGVSEEGEEEGSDEEEDPDEEGEEEGGDLEEDTGDDEEEEPEPTPEPIQKKPDNPKPEEPEVEQPQQLSEEEIQAQKEAAFNKLVETFALSEEDANLALTRPEEYLPKMQAALYQRLALDAIQMIQQQQQALLAQMPNIMQAYTQQSAQEQQVENAFFEAHPGLKEHSGQVQQLLTPQVQGQDSAIVSQAKLVLQQQGKELTQENVIDMVGKTLGAMMGVDTRGKPQKRKSPASQAHKPVNKAGGAVHQPDVNDDLSPVDSFIEELILNR